MFWYYGQPLQVEGALQATSSFPGGGGPSYTGTFVVSRQLCAPLQCTLGWDFLTTICLSLNRNQNSSYSLIGKYGEIPLTPEEEISECHLPTFLENPLKGPEPRVLFTQSQSKGPVPITLNSSISIPGRTEVLVTGKLPKSYAEEFGMVSSVSKDSIPTNILVAYSVCQAGNRDIPVRIMNSSTVALQLESGQQICEFCPLVDSVPPKPSTNDCPPHPPLSCSSLISAKVRGDLSSALSSSLDDHGRKLILNTLLKFSDVFDESLGQTQVTSHRIDTGNATAVR